MKDSFDLHISTNAVAGGVFNHALRSLAGFDADVVVRAPSVRRGPASRSAIACSATS